MGVALSSNIFSLFVFYEVLAIAAYPLVAHKETPGRSRRGGSTWSIPSSGACPSLPGSWHCSRWGPPLTSYRAETRDCCIAPAFARLAFLLLFAGMGVKSSPCSPARVAAECHGRPDTGERAAPCSCRREHRGVRDPAADAVPLRAGAGYRSRSPEPGDRSRGHYHRRRGSPCPQTGRIQAPACILHDKPVAT